MRFVILMPIFSHLRRQFSTAAIDAIAKNVDKLSAAKKVLSKKSVAVRKNAEPKLDLKRMTRNSLNAILSNPELDEAKERLAQMQAQAREKVRIARLKKVRADSKVETDPKAQTQTDPKAQTQTDPNAGTSRRQRMKPVVFRKKSAAELYNAQKRLEAKAAKENDPELLEAIAEAESYALSVDNIRFDFYRHFDDKVYGKNHKGSYSLLGLKCNSE